MKKIKYIVLLLLCSFAFQNLSAQWEGEDECCPPPPEGVGSRATPIDMYIILLGIVAVFLIIRYAKINSKNKKIA